ncbi:MAG TPA: NlpC/P60 family protein [Chthoniobacteraceae bacterium]|jgi:cell wall-associated NlpC family hydrolase
MMFPVQTSRVNFLLRLCGVLLILAAPLAKAQTSTKTAKKSGSSTTPRAKSKSTPAPEKAAASGKKSNQGAASASGRKSAKAPAESADPATTPAPAKKSRPPHEPALPGEAESTAAPEQTSAPKTNSAAAATATPASKSYDRENASSTPASTSERAPAATLEPTDLAEFSAQPPRVQAVLAAALDLTKRNLTYAYGSADPAQGGMDCSGTMYYVLRAHGFPDVPRDSSGQYVWARKKGQFFAVVSTKAESFEFDDLLPGDLMFWTGTYQVTRDVPVSHVMLYLGTEKATGKRVMFGASDGRSYNGIQRWGVSVFDFKMPKADTGSAEKSRVDFIGYARIPALRNAAEGNGAASVVAADAPAPAAAAEQVANGAAEEAAEPQPAATPRRKKATRPKAASTPEATPRKRSKKTS